jgi:transcriptional regulator with XRE-family HTH domain
MRSGPTVINHLPRLLRQHGITWSELGRRTLLSRRHLAHLRAHDANPPLVVAERVAAAIGAPIESLWQLVEPWPR